MSARQARTPTPETLAQYDHAWMTQARCAQRLDLPWTEDAHRVEEEVREVMARLCRACPVRGYCRRYAVGTYASAGFWAGGFRGGAYTGDLPDLLAELPEAEVQAHYEPNASHAGHVHRKAMAS